MRIQRLQAPALLGPLYCAAFLGAAGHASPGETPMVPEVKVFSAPRMKLGEPVAMFVEGKNLDAIESVLVEPPEDITVGPLKHEGKKTLRFELAVGLNAKAGARLVTLVAPAQLHEERAGVGGVTGSVVVIAHSDRQYA